MTNATNTTIANNLYPVANATSSSNPFVWEFKARDPTLNDVNFPIQKFWLNTTNDGIWFLKNFVSSNGVVTANWIFLATGGQQFQSLSDTANTVVFPSPSSGAPPNNIQLIGGTGINIVSNPGSNSITFTASGSAVVEQFAMQTGTSPVNPLAGVVTFNGAVVAAGTHPVRTDGTGPNTMALEVQTSQAIAATDATKIGLSAFNSAQFSVDANGFVSATGSIPIQFTENTGTATPAAGNLNIFGASTVAGISPVSTTGSGSTVTVNVQKSQAIASTNATNVGLAAFDSARFSVDANGFVTINGTGVGETITGQSGGALSPVAGNWNIFGGTVVAGSSPLVTSGSGNTLTINAQRSQAIASTDSTKIGLAAFNSADFTVDANGFVTLVGGAAATNFTVDTNTPPGTNPVVPNGSGNIIVTGAQVAAGTTTNVIRTDSLAANSYTIQIQRSQAVASSTIGDNGVSHFNSAQFSVDGNGFVSATGAIPIQFTGNTGTAVPAAGNINIFAASTAAGTSPASTTASGSTVTVNVQKSQAIASTNAFNVGLAAFDSARFGVDANGFVTINGAGVGETITGQSGGALSPTAGNWNIFGGTVAAGTSPLVTSGSGSTLTINAQRSQAIAATDSTKIGLSAFNSADFTVDANGFVTLVGGAATTNFTVDANSAPGTNPVVPNGSGNVTITGGQVAAGTTTNVIRTDSLAANAYTIQVQRSQAVASSTIGNNGVSHFNSANFTVDANGFVSAQPLTLNYTNVNHAASPYTVLTTDYYISVDCSAGTVTLNFPNAPTFKQVWIVKDRTGNASTNNISITTPGGTVTIDGLTTYKITSNYGAINLLANATPTYEVY